MKNNLKLWDSVQKTDPKYTKEVNFGRKFTSINAHYQVKCMTKEFGPKGKGWGVDDEVFHTLVEHLVGYQAKLWYIQDGKRFEFAINSSIATHQRNGKLDDECYKKVTTDALTKGISQLGFNADIFLGMWDDNRYVSQMKKEFSEPTSEKKEGKWELKVKDEKWDVVLKWIANHKEKGLANLITELEKDLYVIGDDVKVELKKHV
mgnify:CR=1 FL=1|tara:strand:- start:149 stop:763 length:615 start_codon:yes stop_codon:yes gene_type:complete